MSDTDPSWTVVAASVRGSAHVRAGTPSEDSCARYVDQGVAAAVVADGHGSDRCFRSAIGSQRAAAIGLQLLRGAASEVDGAAFAAAIEQQVGPSLLDRWRRAVLDHAADHPLSADELALLDLPPGEEPTDSALVMAYGTTFAGIVIAHGRAAAVQVGDGDAVVVTASGSVRRPVPEDDQLVGNVTTSLASALADDVRTWVGLLDEEPLHLAWVSTDGFGGAYASPDWFLDVGAQLFEEHRTSGAEVIEAKLQGWLREPAQVAGDDATMAILLSPRGPAEGVVGDG